MIYPYNILMQYPLINFRSIWKSNFIIILFLLGMVSYYLSSAFFENDIPICYKYSVKYLAKYSKADGIDFKSIYKSFNSFYY
jgi:hypothetical protein